MATTIWTIDQERSRIEFSLRYYTFSRVTGSFAKWSGRIQLDDDGLPRSDVEVEIDPTSVRTGIEERDRAVAKHFFAAEAFPRVTFKSRTVEATGDQACKVTGDLEMRGVVHPVTLAAERVGGSASDARFAFRATTEVARKRWGVLCRAQGDLSPLLIGSTVSVRIEIEATKSR